jgi:glucosamine kinase
MGDEGSGAVLGRALLSLAMRAEDGFALMTPLLQQVLEDLGGIEGVIGFGNRATPADFARLAPRIIGSDDPAARQVFDAAVAEVRHILLVLQADAPLPVVFVGGLGPAYAARLTDWPQRPALGSGLDGALLMARQMAGAA